MRSYLKVLSAFIILVFFLKTNYIADSRLTIGIGFVISFLLGAIARTILVPKGFFYLVSKGYIVKKTVIIGAGEHGQFVCARLLNNPKSYFEIVGFCDDDFDKAGKTVCGKLVLGTSYELESMIGRYHIKEVIIAISNIRRGALLDIIDRCKKVHVAIHVISDLMSIVNEKMEAEEFGGFRTFRIVSRNMGIVNQSIKRAMDFAVSGLLLVLLVPLFAVVAWAVKRDSEGPVFYRSEVVGRGSGVFWAYKFRSMVSDNGSDPLERERCEQGNIRHIEFMKELIKGRYNTEFYVKDEDRVTKVGRILRKYSIDELPQLVNVFRGEMSLVGPRFCSPKEYEFYKPWHKRRFQVKPGLTGLWQVRARSEVSYDDMVMLDLYYIDNWSLLLDFEILLRTVSVVVFGKGSRID